MSLQDDDAGSLAQLTEQFEAALARLAQARQSADTASAGTPSRSCAWRWTRPG